MYKKKIVISLMCLHVYIFRCLSENSCIGMVCTCIKIIIMYGSFKFNQDPMISNWSEEDRIKIPLDHVNHALSLLCYQEVPRVPLNIRPEVVWQNSIHPH